MDKEIFARINVISEKAMLNEATEEELKEYNNLMTLWNNSTHYNVFNLPEYFLYSTN